MNSRMLAAMLVLFVFVPFGASTPTQPAAPSPDQGIAVLLQALEKAAASGQAEPYLQLVSPAADRANAVKFARSLFDGRRFDRATLRERDRSPLPGTTPGDGFRLVVEVLFESGNRGRLATWQIDVRRQAGSPPTAGATWTIDGQQQLSSLENLYRLSLDTKRQFAGKGLVVTAPDLEIALTSGAAFTADSGEGETAVVLVGKGEMTFSPAAEAERGQVRIFSGSETLRTRFDACVVRMNPADLANHLRSRRAAESVDARQLQRAQEAFAAASQSFTVDLGDLSPGPWSIQPAYGDFLAEVRTPRFGTLTYSRSMIEPEDVALFDRVHRRYIALYASKETLAARGRFYADDERADYEALHYDVNASFVPEREWIEGRTRMVLRVRAPSVSALQVRLADALAVRSVVLEPFGRVLAVRARGRDAVIVSLPEPLARGAVATLTIAYAGRLPPQTNRPDAAAFEGARKVQPRDLPAVEPSYLYSAATAWYAQPPVTGFATATLHLTVPAQYNCVASGALVSTSPASPANPTNPTKVFVFDAARPVRYLACLIGRLVKIGNTTVPLAGLSGTAPQARADSATHGPSLVVSSPHLDSGGASSDRWPAVSSEALTVVANRQEQGQSGGVASEAQDIVRFYTSLVGDCPYPDLTVALIERDLPGGHSPAYLAILDQQSPMSRLAWRDDPTSFRGFPDFFVAHEIAHQWWGQAIGAKNYHEEWLSEGFAQYFAALYADHAHGHPVFAGIMRQMQHWALADSPSGPVYLGDRIGQVKSDGRALRAVVYDKAAVALHMLRRLMGDRAFFGGLRRYYRTWRFRKAGSDDLRQALETECGMPLERFFERWIYGDTVPAMKFSWRVERGARGSDDLVLRFEQQISDVFDVPITVTIEYAGRPRVDVIVPVTDRVVERRIQADGRVRNVTANRDELAPVRISK